MPGLDETKQFVPLKIAVLTISDTRSLKDDKSGAVLVQRIVAAGHYVAERSIVADDSLSTYGHNIKIVVENGVATLKGPVRTEEEKAAIAAKAAAVVGQDHIVDQMEIAPQ